MIQASLKKELILVFFGLTAAVFFAEILFRIYYKVTFTGSIENIADRKELLQKGAFVTFGKTIRLSSDNKIIYELRPNIDVFFNSSTGHFTHLKTNSSGFRDKEFSLVKDPNTRRIIGIGDSVMFGWGVDEDKRYMDILEKQLNKFQPAYDWETYVFAVPGYNLPMEVEVLKHYAILYQPDLLIYGHVENDSCLPYFVQNKKNIFLPESFIYDYLFHRISKKRINIAGNMQFVERPGMREICEQSQLDQNLYRALVGEKNFQKALQELQSIGEKKGIPVVFVDYIFSPYPQKRLPQSMFSVDIKNRFEQESKASGHTQFVESGLVISKEDQHPTYKGHQLIAEELYKMMVDQKLTDFTRRSL